MATSSDQLKVFLPRTPIPANFNKIEHFVVLMLENRSFDHLFGRFNDFDPDIVGVDNSMFNYEDPLKQTGKVAVEYGTTFAMQFDPPHEFDQVQTQLFGPSPTTPGQPATPASPAPMSGFIAAAIPAASAAGTAADAHRVMECFSHEDLPIFGALAKEFAVINSWFSSMPGPTWPNRFFVHAATSGGLRDSPTPAQMATRFRFAAGTIFDRLTQVNRPWCVYHDGLPQVAGIDNMFFEMLNKHTQHFREMRFFQQDLQGDTFPAYTFIEPRYDTGGNFVNGNSMHPLNDIQLGEELIKSVYESLRNSKFWATSMLVITFDEHGGFFDHVPPPAALPTGDDVRYNTSPNFAFDRLGVRVPALVISPYTQPGTVIGNCQLDNPLVFDHACIPATLEKRFNLTPLTHRDEAALNSGLTLDVAINWDQPRLDPNEAPISLPDPSMKYYIKSVSSKAAAAPLSPIQQTFVSLAAAADLATSSPSVRSNIREQQTQIQTSGQAAGYIKAVEDKINHARKVT